MKFDKLRIVGFKSFCEATEFKIEPGLTGVVGPNGCGKSNLVEALRWVMGESSYKNMRASGMEDVIFSGSGGRPSRNNAEVALVLDNSSRSAPAAFNDCESIEITRRIERDEGSTYRFNGKEIRARDVQLLFADAATGARSPALVRQGQIGEIISAKPQQRRRILEDAAGVAGLHSRRHEAELRLKAAEENLLRLEDVLKQIHAQADNLRRQARQASRYKGLAADIRRQEALVFHIGHEDIRRQIADAETRLEAETLDVAERTRQQAEAARLQAVAAYGLPALRDGEARAGAALQRLIIARDQLDVEERRARERSAELERRVAQLTRDLARETALIEDAAGVVAKLASEAEALAEQAESSAESEFDAKSKLADAEGRLSEAEYKLTEAQASLSDINARREALLRAFGDETRRHERHIADLAAVEAEHAALLETSGEDELVAAREALEEARAIAEAAEEALLEREEAHAGARDREAKTRAPLAEADRAAQRLETEVRTLTKLLANAASDLWPPVVEHIAVEKGYEAALGAALGDDLEASANSSAPAHWALVGDPSQDPALPPGVQPLARLVTAPPALGRRLAQIGVVTRADGPQLRALLKPGQRLVTKEGDLWRWDGFTAAAEAPTPAARRLVEKNRLGDLTREAVEARAAAETLKAEAERHQTALREEAAAETRAREDARARQRAVEQARDAAAELERKRGQVAARLSALAEARARLAMSRDEAHTTRADAEKALADLAPNQLLIGRVDRARAAAAQCRAETAEARALVQGLGRDAQAREQRRAAIATEQRSWDERRARASGQIDELQARIEEAREELEQLAEAPDQFILQRRDLIGQIDAADAARKEAADARTLAETALADADRAARACIDGMSAAREQRARTEALLEGHRARHEAIVRAIASELECEPAQLPALAGIGPNEALPDLAEVERKLDALKQDRERLGAVNLRADDELEEVDKKHSDLLAERDDLAEAIRKLRGAIGNLNKEGRERLLAAFTVVNAHFQELFTALFGGGTAELQLIESDDPLEAGLEILARPPGKKPTTMTLLSGGEQALTAMSLIFAVFLTNPSPICVLDEVDAPLDDHNVERFCDLLEEMRKKTDTRFVTITHNPITMARMDRLFGVTMAERGVSQLVSVDLVEAEQLVAAE